MACGGRDAPEGRVHVDQADQTLDKQAFARYQRAQEINRMKALEEYARRSTGLKSMPGSFGHTVRWHEDELLCCWQRCGEDSRNIRRHWGVLHQEEDKTVRRLRGRSIM
jgi:hypothetical protein